MLGWYFSPHIHSDLLTGAFVVACHKQNVVSIVVVINEATARQAARVLDFVSPAVSCELSELRLSWGFA